jgi:hypothetical protein
VACLCLGPVAGIVAIVLGILGMKKAGEIGTGKGMALAGLILGIVGTILGVVIVVAIAAGGDSISDSLDDIGGAADPDDYEISLPADACSIDEFGFITFQGTIENTANRDMSFVIEGTIRDTADDVVIDRQNTYVDVAEGDTARWEIVASVDEPVDITCNVSGVDNLFN